MLINTLKSAFLYLTTSLFILGWWLVAFGKKQIEPFTNPTRASTSLSISSSTVLAQLSPISREALHQALAGDFALMGSLIQEWRTEATRLEKKGLANISHLPSPMYEDSQFLARLITQSSDQDLQALNEKLRVPALEDDIGTIIYLNASVQRFLPQTYAAASVLLAIAKPEEILAIPRHLRALPELYSPALLQKIRLDAERQEGEKLYAARPDIAFVAPYSHPPTLQALKKQNIKLCTLHSQDTIEGIKESLLKIGHIANHALEANLLRIFIESALLMLDNRLQVLYQLSLSEKPKELLYLTYYQQFSMPTTKCLSGQLLQRLLKQYPTLHLPLTDTQTEWAIPFGREKILTYQPDCLILSASTPHVLQHLIETTPAFLEVPAFKTQRVFQVDDSVQKSPSQYIVLAYFDLVHAIELAHLP